jgi:hypothetical protein
MKKWSSHAMPLTVAAAVLFLLFAARVLWAFYSPPPGQQSPSFRILHERNKVLATITNDIQRDSLCIPLSAMARSLDYRLPPDTRIFMASMLGTNAPGRGYYYFMTSYLFPRPVDVSFREPPVFTDTHLEGESAPTVQALQEEGYGLLIHFAKDGRSDIKALRPLPEVPPPDHVSGSKTDRWIALAIPPVFAAFGVLVLGFLAPRGLRALGVGEMFAAGLAIGIIALTQISLALQLAGFPARRVLFWIAAGGGAVAIFRFRPRAGRAARALRPTSAWPLYSIILLTGPLFFLLFQLAGLEGVQEYDAAASWMLKARILHLFHGQEMLEFFSSPRLAHSHLDYPTTIPDLHAMTYGMLGRINEFTTKYWPAWMLLLLTLAVIGAHRRSSAPGRTAAVGAISAALLIPATLQYSRWEGATIPMLFFAALGALQCTLGLRDSRGDRLVLGLLLLFSSALIKFEGAILFALWTAGILLSGRAARRLLVRDRKALWRAAGFAALAIIPYAYFRLSIPVLHPESNWMQLAIQNPLHVLRHAPTVFLVFVARRFCGDSLIQFSWSDNDGLRWMGTWNGWRSLIDEPTAGLAWALLIVFLLLLYGKPSHRKTLLIHAAVLFAFPAVISIVFVSLPRSLDNIQHALQATETITGGRYFYPVLLSAWLCLPSFLEDPAPPDG